MYYKLLLTILLGVAGGIISSIIVSRVFWIMSDLKDSQDILDTEYGKLCFLHGSVDVIKLLIKDDYDRVTKSHNSSEDEKSITPYSKEDLKPLLDGIKKEADKEWIYLVYLNIKGKEVTDIIDTFIRYLDKLKAIDIPTFEFIDGVETLFGDCRQRIDNYKSKNGKRFVKRILSDKIMIVLYVIVLLIILATILTAVFNV